MSYTSLGDDPGRFRLCVIRLSIAVSTDECVKRSNDAHRLLFVETAKQRDSPGLRIGVNLEYD